MPLPLKIVVDSVLGSHPLPQFLDPFVPSWIAASPGATLWFAVALVLLIALLGLMLRLGSWILQEYLGEKIVLEFRSKLFEHVSQLSLAQHDRRGGGDLTYRIQYDAPAIRWLVMDGAVPFLTALLTLFAMLYVIARLDFRLGMVALIIVPAIFFLTQIYSRRLRTSWRRVKTAETSALSVVQEVIGAIRVVKAFGQEHREQKRLFDVARQGILERIRVIVAESEFSLLIGITARRRHRNGALHRRRGCSGWTADHRRAGAGDGLYCPALRAHSDDGEADSCAARLPRQRGTSIIHSGREPGCGGSTQCQAARPR